MLLSNFNREMFSQPCQCGRRLDGFGQEDVGAGGGATTTAARSGAGPGRSIALGVTTGLIIWLVTRTLDGAFRR